MAPKKITSSVQGKRAIMLQPRDLLEEHGFSDGWILVDIFNLWWLERDIVAKYGVCENERKNNTILRSYFSLEVLTIEVVVRHLLPKLNKIDTDQIKRFWPEHFPLAKSYNPIRVYVNSNNLLLASEIKHYLNSCDPVLVSKDEIYRLADELFLGVSKELLLINDYILDGKYEEYNNFNSEYKKAFRSYHPLKATEEFVVRAFLEKLRKENPDTLYLGLDLAKSRSYSKNLKLSFKSMSESIKTARLVLKTL